MNAKNQSSAQRRQAFRAVEIYRGMAVGVPHSSNAAAAVVVAPASGYSPSSSWEHVFRQLKDEIALRNYSPRTYTSYAHWIGSFQTFLKSSDPGRVGSAEVKRFLSDLAIRRKVAASTQNQAFNALLFLFRHIFQRDFDVKDGVVRAKRRKYIPVVLSRAEIDQVMKCLDPAYVLVVQLLYGCGLRLTEAVNLRVQDINLEEGILTVHDGKGQKDRTVPLPEVLRPELQEQINLARALFQRDLEDGFDGVFMPRAIDRKWKNAPREFHWQWLFAARLLTLMPEEGIRLRYHLHESHLQKAIKAAVRKSGITKRATAHTFRHSFASHLLQANYDIRTIQEMLGHSDVRTTMIYTHTVKSRTLKERRSPLDFEPA